MREKVTLLKSMTLLQILIMLGNSASAITLQKTGIISNPDENFVSASRSEKLFVGLTKTSVYIEGNPTPAKIPTSTLINFEKIGEIGCWNQQERCVICGEGGCLSLSISPSKEIRFHQNYNHSHYNNTVNGNSVQNYVSKILVLEETNFFFTVESMIKNEGGIFRWDLVITTCFDRFDPGFEAYSEHYYDLELAPFTQNLILSNFKTSSLLVLSVEDMKEKKRVSLNGFKPLAITIFGQNPGECKTVLCSDEGKCQEWNYCTGSFVREYSFNSGGNVVDISTVDVTDFTQSDFFVTVHDSKGLVFKLGENTPIANFQNSENFEKIFAKSYFTDLIILTKNSLSRVLFTKDVKTTCHSYCKTKDCDYSFSRYRCKDCDLPFASSDLGCTRASIQGSSELIGNVVPSPASIKIDISHMICKDQFITKDNNGNKTDGNNKNPIQNYAKAKIEDKDMLMAVLIFLIIGTIFTVAILGEKILTRRKQRKEAKKSLNTKRDREYIENDQNESSLSMNYSIPPLSSKLPREAGDLNRKLGRRLKGRNRLKAPGVKININDKSNDLGMKGMRLEKGRRRKKKVTEIIEGFDPEPLPSDVFKF